jgi:hypothetical protein
MPAASQPTTSPGLRRSKRDFPPIERNGTYFDQCLALARPHLGRLAEAQAVARRGIVDNGAHGYGASIQAARIEVADIGTMLWVADRTIHDGIP